MIQSAVMKMVLEQLNLTPEALDKLLVDLGNAINQQLLGFEMLKNIDQASAANLPIIIKLIDETPHDELVALFKKWYSGGIMAKISSASAAALAEIRGFPPVTINDGDVLNADKLTVNIGIKHKLDGASEEHF